MTLQIEDILDRAKQVAQQAEVYALSYEETPVRFEVKPQGNPRC